MYKRSALRLLLVSIGATIQPNLLALPTLIVWILLIETSFGSYRQVRGSDLRCTKLNTLRVFGQA